MNLIRDPWLPVRRASGRKERIAPWQITEKNDPVLTLESGRPDFDGSLMQFLIGLLQTATPPADNGEWSDRLENPLELEELKSRFLEFETAFELDGDGPRFMQDFENLDVKNKSKISELLIEAPGGNTLKENRDHFIKRGEVERLCPACTAIALFTLQTNAPSGGVGHRTSLRGGGPLTTLVSLDPQGSGLKDTLWRNLWLNVLDVTHVIHLTGSPQKASLSDIFPWLVSTRTSEPNSGQITTPEDANPLQMYWNMPRRIRIPWDAQESGFCDLCGEESSELVRDYITKNYGVNYEGAWQHPLSPHSKDKKTEAFLPKHPQPGGIAYRHWLGLVAKTDWSVPAYVSGVFREERQIKKERFRLHAFGYDMDNMKARCWYESVYPLYCIPEELVQAFVYRVESLLTTANDAAKALQSSVKEAWFERPGDVKGNTSFLEDAFYSHTELAFFETIRRLINSLRSGGDEVSVLISWYEVIVRSAIDLFDYWATRNDFSQEDPRRIASAHANLRKKLDSKRMKDMLKISEKEEVA